MKRDPETADGGLKREERRNVASAIVRRSRRLSLEELAARGKRHVRVLTAGEAFQEIESVVNETSSERANEIAHRDRAWVFEEAKQQFDRAAQLRNDSERLVREQSELIRQDADRVAELEKRLRDELLELKSSVKALEEKSSRPDPEYMEKLFDELSRREEASRTALESRLETTMSATIDAVRRTVMAALKGTGDTSVDATSLIVAKVLDDEGRALESNVAGLGAADARVTDARVARGVRENLARLKELRRGPAAGTQPSPARAASEAAGPRPTASPGGPPSVAPELTASEAAGPARPSEPEANVTAGPDTAAKLKEPEPQASKTARSSRAAEQKPRRRAGKSTKPRGGKRTKET